MDISSRDKYTPLAQQQHTSSSPQYNSYCVDEVLSSTNNNYLPHHHGERGGGTTTSTKNEPFGYDSSSPPMRPPPLQHPNNNNTPPQQQQTPHRFTVGSPLNPHVGKGEDYDSSNGDSNMKEQRISLSPIYVRQEEKRNVQAKNNNNKQDVEIGLLLDDVPTSVILTEFSGTSLVTTSSDEAASEDEEEGIDGGKLRKCSSSSRSLIAQHLRGKEDRNQRRTAKIVKRKQEKLRCIVDICRRLKTENANLRGSLKKQHRELTGYRSMHSSLTSLPADFTAVPPLSARGEPPQQQNRNQQNQFGDSAATDPQMPPLPPAPPTTNAKTTKREDYHGPPISFDSCRKGATEHKTTLASLLNSSGNNPTATTTTATDPVAVVTTTPKGGGGPPQPSSPPLVPISPEQRLLDQVNSIGVVSSSSSSSEQCILLLRHLLFRTMLQCRAGEDMIHELERERRGTAITVMKIKQENEKLVQTRDEVQNALSRLQNRCDCVADDEGADEGEGGGRNHGSKKTIDSPHHLGGSINNIATEESQQQHRDPTATSSTTTSKRKMPTYNLSQRHVAGGGGGGSHRHSSVDSSAPVSPAHHHDAAQRSNATTSGGYGLSSNGGGGGHHPHHRRTSSSAQTGLGGGGGGGGGGAASFVRSLSADRSVGSSSKFGHTNVERPGTPASTGVGFRRSRPFPQLGQQHSSSVLLLDEQANLSGELPQAAVELPPPPPLTSARGGKPTTAPAAAATKSRPNQQPVVPPLRRLATSPTVQARRSPRGPAAAATAGRRTTTTMPVNDVLRLSSSVRTPISTRPKGGTIAANGSFSITAASSTNRTTSPSATLRSNSAKRLTLTNSGSHHHPLKPSPSPSSHLRSNGLVVTRAVSPGISSARAPPFAAGGTLKPAAATKAALPAGNSTSSASTTIKDKQRALLSHSPRANPQGVAPATPSGRRTTTTTTTGIASAQKSAMGRGGGVNASRNSRTSSPLRV